MSVSSISTKKKRTVSSSSLRKPQVIHLNDPFLEQVLAEDEEYLNVLCIRNEIIENALDLCHESYLKTQSVKYLVDCLHKAFIDVLNISLMHYNSSTITQREIWTPDSQLEPLAPDNYAEFSVPFITADEEVQEEKKLSLESYVDYDVEPKISERKPSASETFKQTTTFAKLPGEEEYEEAVGGKLMNDKALEEESLKYEDMSLYETGNVGEYEGHRRAFDSSTSELFEQIHSESSFFTGVVEAEQNFLPYIEPLRCENFLPKITEYPKEKSHKSTVWEMTKNVTGTLPPLRLKAKFKYRDNSRSTVKFGRSVTSLDRSAAFSMNAKERNSKNSACKQKESDEMGRDKERKRVDIDDRVQEI